MDGGEHIGGAARVRWLAKGAFGRSAAGALQVSRRRAGVALLYHGVALEARPRADELVPSVPLALFERQVEYVARRYAPVRASELPAAVARRGCGRPLPVAVTFDDDDAAYRRLVLPVLERFGVPATFFLNGASLERPWWFWWERMQAAWDRGLVDARLAASLGVPGAREALRAERPLIALGDAVSALDPAAVEGVQSALAARLGGDPPAERMGADDVRALVGAGHEIGFHTRRHPYLPGLGADGLDEAMRDGRDALAALSGAPLLAFAYPSGGVDAPVVDAARRAGYRVAFTTRREPVTPERDPLELGRIVAPPGTIASLSSEIARTLAGHPRR